MEYLVTAGEMKEYDRYTSQQLLIPECVLMERASVGVADVVVDILSGELNNHCVPVFICGYGNNGGDGICCARILKEKGIDSKVILIGNPDKASELNVLQQNILEQFGIKAQKLDIKGAIDYLQSLKTSPLVIDALFGVGLSRPLSEEYGLLTDAVNKYASYVVSVDVPSGLSAEGGAVFGPAVKADVTVTFGFRKLCHVLFPAKALCGEVKLVQMGITEKSIAKELPKYKAITSTKDFSLPKSIPGANKGTYKKLLIIAGSSEVYGAAFLAAKAALACGIGMITILTHEKNRLVLEQSIPEAIYRFYDDDTDADELRNMFDKSQAWADGILIGPGIGLGEIGRMLTEFTVKYSAKPLVVDADAVRIVAGDEKLQELLICNERRIIFTPHLAEFAALAGITVKEASEGLADLPKRIADKYKITVNCKDASSVIASWDEREMIINCTGNDGMASGGSGDVLCGITAVFLLQMQNAYEAASMAAYIHGLAGDIARDKLGRRAMTATNIIEELFGLWEA